MTLWKHFGQWLRAAPISARSYRIAYCSAFRKTISTRNRHHQRRMLFPARELQVLRLVADGKTSKGIAVMLDLGLQTIRSYCKTMLEFSGWAACAAVSPLPVWASTYWSKAFI